MRGAQSVAQMVLALTLTACTAAAPLPSPTVTAEPVPASTPSVPPSTPPLPPTAPPTTPPTTPTVTPAPTPTKTPPPTPTPSPSATPTAAPSATAPTSVRTDFTVGGARPVIVHVPTGYDPSRPAPLLVMLHGYGSSGAQHERYFRLAAAADERGMLYAHPNGTRDSDRERFWNATDACCDFEGRGIADADYLAGIVAEIAATVSVDSERIFFVGHSNGGFMSHAMACSHAGLVTGIVSFAGMAPADPADCRASEPVAVLQIHGDADEVVQYEGGRLEPGTVDAPGEEALAPYPSVDETAALWLELNGCSGLVRSPTRLDVDARIDGPSGPAEAVVRQSTGCEPGGHVETWTVPDGGHAFEFSPTFQELVLDFLLTR